MMVSAATSVSTLLLATTSLLALGLFAEQANAGCTLASPANDTVLCDAATSPDPEPTTVDLLAGDDVLTVNSGTYGGGFTGGSGVKTIFLNGGVIAGYTNTVGTSAITFSPASTATVTGSIVTGGGQDLFEIDSGTVSGAVSQGNGIDTFIMRGGSIGALAQGDSRDIFIMSGGTIVGAFEDGDVATMTGGTIGRVDMKLDKNIFDMSGGTIIGNLVTGFDDDQIFVSQGSIGGNISVSGGNDVVQITGGSVSGEVRMSTGSDRFLWQGAGTVGGLIDMGPGNDLATLRNLADGTIAPSQAITGGTGLDEIVLAGFGPSVLDAGAITSFETLSKTEPGLWTLGGSLTDITSATVYEGTLRLTGQNGGYGGSMTVAPAGTLEGGASALTPLILSNGIVRFTQGVDEIYAGTITGGGAVEKVGQGTLALTAASSYAGGTTISEGTLQLGTGGPSGSIIGSVAIGAGGILAFNRSDDVLWFGNISGSGNLVQIGPGRLDLAGGAGDGFAGDLYVQGGVFGMVQGATLAPADTYVGQAPSGLAGSGTLLLSTGAVLTTPGDFIAGPVAGSTGTVVIGGLEGTAPVAPGAINTPTLSFGPGDGRLVFNHSSSGYQFDLQSPQTGVGTIAGDGEIDVLAGRTILNAAHAGFGGSTRISGGALQVNGILGGTVDVLAGGRLEGNGFVGPTSNAGTVAPGTSIGTLTILGDYAGAGGILETEVVLGGDASLSDLLAITGTSTGTTRVDVVNLGGQGAPTQQGIRIVRVDGASPGTFSLIPDTIAPTGEAAVIGGAYVYGLYQGSPAAPADGDWYLRTIVNPPLVVPTLPPVGPVDPDLPAGPVYQPGVPLHEAYPQVLMSLNRLPTLQQRKGNRAWSGTADPQPFVKGALASTPPGDVIAGSGAWARIEGSRIVADPAVSTSFSDYDIDLWRLQAGYDFDVAGFADGSSLIGGINVHYGRADADITSPYGAGSIEATGYGVGGTLTWYGQSGLYVDGQAHATWYDSDIYSDRLAIQEADGNNGFGYAFGIEAGKAIDIAYQWTLTPQAQLVYSNVDFDTFDDAYRATVRRLGGDSLNGRLGLSIDHERSWQGNAGDTRRLKGYAIANLTYEFLDGTEVGVGTASFTAREDRFWGGLGLGATYDWANDAYSLYGEIGARGSMESFGDAYALDGTIGFKARF